METLPEGYLGIDVNVPHRPVSYLKDKMLMFSYL